MWNRGDAGNDVGRLGQSRNGLYTRVGTLIVSTIYLQHVENIQYVYLLNKYLKCSFWRLALRYDIYICMSLGFKRLTVAVCRSVHAGNTRPVFCRLNVTRLQRESSQMPLLLSERLSFDPSHLAVH